MYKVVETFSVFLFLFLFLFLLFELQDSIHLAYLSIQSVYKLMSNNLVSFVVSNNPLDAFI